MSNLTVSEFLLSEIDPFAACAADAAILYLTDCADSSLSRSLVFEYLSVDPLGHLWWHGPMSLQPSGKRTPSQKLMIEGCNSFVQFIPRRFLYAWAYGYENLPDGKDVEFSTREKIHSNCGVTACMNPEHLSKTHVYELGKINGYKRSGALASGDVS
jgi:hypothetical protein